MPTSSIVICGTVAPPVTSRSRCRKPLSPSPETSVNSILRRYGNVRARAQCTVESRYLVEIRGCGGAGSLCRPSCLRVSPG